MNMIKLEMYVSSAFFFKKVIFLFSIYIFKIANKNYDNSKRIPICNIFFKVRHFLVNTTFAFVLFYIAWMNFSEAFKYEHYKTTIKDISSTTPSSVETQIPGKF